MKRSRMLSFNEKVEFAPETLTDYDVYRLDDYPMNFDEDLDYLKTEKAKDREKQAMQLSFDRIKRRAGLIFWAIAIALVLWHLNGVAS